MEQGSRNHQLRVGVIEGNDKETNESTELWYKVRLRPSESPAPAGWVFGKQVELTVPSDIIFYRTGREFVAWQRLDETDAAKQWRQKEKMLRSRHNREAG